MTAGSGQLHTHEHTPIPEGVGMWYVFGHCLLVILSGRGYHRTPPPHHKRHTVPLHLLPGSVRFYDTAVTG